MAGIYPNETDGGVDPGVTVPPSFDPVIDPVGTLAKYFSQNCGVVLRPETLNAIISQISAAIDGAGIAYQLSGGHKDLSKAIQYYIQLNMGAYAEATGGPLHYTALGSPTFYRYKPGQVLWLKMPDAVAPSSNADLAVDGLPIRRLVRADGSNMASGDLQAGQVTGLVYKGNDTWQMVGGGADFMPIARARLPYFPDIQTPTKKFGVFAPVTGQIQIPAGLSFLHRGIYLANTSDWSTLTFTTVANSGYHLRWSPAGGFRLVNTADPGYNPGAVSEASVGFDSTYDDMLVARVVTNSANVATITDLINATRYTFAAIKVATVGTYTYTQFTTNFARSPEAFLRDQFAPGSGTDTDYDIAISQTNRYVTIISSYAAHNGQSDTASPGFFYHLIMPPAG